MKKKFEKKSSHGRPQIISVATKNPKASSELQNFIFSENVAVTMKFPDEVPRVPQFHSPPDIYTCHPEIFIPRPIRISCHPYRYSLRHRCDEDSAHTVVKLPHNRE